MQKMLDAGVSTRRGIMCAHREEVYRAMPCAPLPHSETAQDRTIILPLYPQMSEREIDQVANALKKATRP
jgi:dTDP-4-amino-4,6-dideoxygalactose transaminase